MRFDLLNKLGVAYLCDSIQAAMEERIRTENYRIYETDCLYYMAEALGVKLSRRYYQIIHPVPEDKRTGEEIAAERLEHFGIKVVD